MKPIQYSRETGLPLVEDGYQWHLLPWKGTDSVRVQLERVENHKFLWFKWKSYVTEDEEVAMGPEWLHGGRVVKAAETIVRRRELRKTMERFSGIYRNEGRVR